jgi:hypothetical protein
MGEHKPLHAHVRCPHFCCPMVFAINDTAPTNTGVIVLLTRFCRPFKAQAAVTDVTTDICDMAGQSHCTLLIYLAGRTCFRAVGH